MNGKAQKAVHIVDNQKEKSKAVNKKVNKKFMRNQDEWSFVPSFYIEALKMVSNVVLIPVVLIAAVLEGIRAGFIAGMQKALAMYKVT